MRVIRVDPLKLVPGGEGPLIVSRRAQVEPITLLQGPPGNALNHFVVRTAHTVDRELALGLAKLRARTLERPVLLKCPIFLSMTEAILAAQISLKG